MNALLPLTPCGKIELIEEVKMKRDKQKNSVSIWTVYTKMNTRIANAAKWGQSFAWRGASMTNDDVWQFLGVILLDGLNQLPVMTKINNSNNPIQGNDFIYNNCGSDATHQYQMFWHFFDAQDPITCPPPQA